MKNKTGVKTEKSALCRPPDGHAIFSLTPLFGVLTLADNYLIILFGTTPREYSQISFYSIITGYIFSSYLEKIYSIKSNA
jgi:hypothetical protein